MWFDKLTTLSKVEGRDDEAIFNSFINIEWDCFASPAMTELRFFQQSLRVVAINRNHKSWILYIHILPRALARVFSFSFNNPCIIPSVSVT